MAIHNPNIQDELLKRTQAFVSALLACDSEQLHRLYDLTFGETSTAPVAPEEADAIHALRLLIEGALPLARDNQATTEGN